MSDPTCQIVFRGKLLSGFDRAQVTANLIQLFKSDATRISALLDAPKTILKSGLSREAAARYQDALRLAGIMVAVVSDAPAAANPPMVAQQIPVNTVAAQQPLADQSTDSVPPTTSTSGISGLTLAAVGARIIEAKTALPPVVDISRLSLAAAGTTLVERQTVAAPSFEFEGFSIATDDKPIDSKEKSAPLNVDISALSLAEVPVEPAENPTELQKLLSTSVG